MWETEVLISEQCGSLGRSIKYIKQGADNVIVVDKSGYSFCASIKDWFLKSVRDILLPYGFPDSVSDDYLDYQIWDTVQAFCSTITSIFTTQAILKGVGVGDASASALSATITWIIKDGTGMLGRIIFTWWKGNSLDSNCKKYRLCADFLNDLAMILELTLPYFNRFSTYILCTSTAMKAIVGVAGSATRAAITQHQAVKGNMAEISAKDGSQETLVNLVASFGGIFLLNYFHGADYRLEWLFILILIILHLYANYKAVTSLIFQNLNEVRFALVLKDYLTLNAVPAPQRINEKEPVFLGRGIKVEKFCGFEIILGQSLHPLTKRVEYRDFKRLLRISANRKYLTIPNLEKREIYVFFQKGEDPQIVISAYFAAVFNALALCIYNNIGVDIYSKRLLHHSNPINRLRSFMKTYEHNTGEPSVLPMGILDKLNEFIEHEINMFFVALEVAGWRTDSHSLEMGEWRIDSLDDKKRV